MYRVAGPRLIRFCSESLFRQTFKPPLRCCSSKPSTTSSLSPLSAKERVEVVTKVRERQSGEESEDSWTKDTKRKPDPRDRKDPRDEKVENTIIRHEHRFANIPDELRNKETFHNAIGMFSI
uniref:Uncharacterized protein n=1 Tax=Plectus sambesii TaxID=2011161 RepID=A0A914V2C1_9BILA